MANGFFDQILEDEINEYVNQWRKEGMSDEEIMRRVENFDFENYYSEATRNISQKNFEFIKIRYGENALMHHLQCMF